MRSFTLWNTRCSHATQLSLYWYQSTLRLLHQHAHWIILNSDLKNDATYYHEHRYIYCFICFIKTLCIYLMLSWSHFKTVYVLYTLTTVTHRTQWISTQWLWRLTHCAMCCMSDWQTPHRLHQHSGITHQRYACLLQHQQVIYKRHAMTLSRSLHTLSNAISLKMIHNTSTF